MATQRHFGRTQPSSQHWQQIGKSAEEILNVRTEMARRRRRLSVLIDWLGGILAHPAFFLVLLTTHLLWIVLNLPLYPWFKPWDPYPFTFLATVTSAEAPFIALLVLMSQRRDSRIDELREEIALQVSLHVERQTTMTLRLLDEIQQQLQIRTQQDREALDHMQQNLDPQNLMYRLRGDLQKAEGNNEATAP